MPANIIPRYLKSELAYYLKTFPAVALLGPRQCGKTTLARLHLKKVKNVLFLDLENPADLRQLNNPELFFSHNRDKLICLDEIQRKPDLFPLLRSVIDERERNGQFLILGSASERLLKQAGETLAGRIGFLELTPFL
ncbi:ATP-binding protein, partial [Candidatus Riflebacteria bacterium]